ncbi:MAG TPA: M56 family metallopeptidase [Bryobacteraceae bacterium]|nr:M56 family metallopeptidase [Bryobacteraceae bacterium]
MSISELESLSRASGAMLLEIVLRSSALAAACALVNLFFRSRTAEIRHLIWHGALYGLLLLPVLQFAAPPLRHASHVLSKAELTVFPVQPIRGTQSTVSKVTPHTGPASEGQAFPWMLIASSIYLAVSAALLLRLGLSLLALEKLLRRSESILDGDLQQLGHDVWLESLSPFKPRIRISTDVYVPMAAGIHEISILLPSSWRLWRRDKLHAVLVHEMAHVRRGDPATAFLSSLAVCLFWIHPLVYWLRRQLAALSEEACDEAALRFVKPEPYSRILIEFVSEVAMARNRLVAASSVVLRRSLIKKRLDRIFSMPSRAVTNYRRFRLCY